jgi:hypothetical protein
MKQGGLWPDRANSVTMSQICFRLLFMPRHCEWIQRLTDIQEILCSHPEILLDRAAIQTVFQVSRRHASRLLQQFGAESIGGARVIPGRELLARLDKVRKEEAVLFELQRRQRLDQKLAAVGRERRSRQIVIPPLTEQPLSLRALPGEIRLEPGELRVSFSTPVELLQRLLQLAQAISEEWADFEAQAIGDRN